MTFELSASARHNLGTAATRRMREAGELPAVVYGAGKDNQAITLDHKTVYFMMQAPQIKTSIIELSLEGEKKPAQVVIQDIKRHPTRNTILHLDLLRIDAKKPIKRRVPIVLIDKQGCAAIKLGARLSQLLSSVEVICLAKDTPHQIDVSVASMKIGKIYRLSDLTLPKGVRLASTLDGQKDLPVVSLKGARGATAASLEAAAQ